MALTDSRTGCRLRAERRVRWAAPWTSPVLATVARNGSSVVLRDRPLATLTVDDLSRLGRGWARDLRPAAEDYGYHVPGTPYPDCGPPLEEWSVWVPDLPTLDDLIDYQARLASEVIPGERNYGRQSKNPDALPDEDDGDGVDYLAASDGRYWGTPSKTAPRERFQSLEVEDDIERLRFGNDVAGWIVWTPPTGGSVGRPPVASLDEETMERLRDDEIGVSVEDVASTWKRRSGGRFTPEETEARRWVASRIVAFVDGAPRGSGRVTLVERAYGLRPEQLRRMRASLSK